MLIVLLHMKKQSNPDYPNMASGLRQLGHEVLLGSLSENDDVVWHDGQRIVQTIAGPDSSKDPETGRELPESSSSLRHARFRTRLRRLLRQLRPDIFQLNPGGIQLSWLVPLYMPASIKFVLDVKQINAEVQPGLAGRLKDWKRLTSLRLGGRACFDLTLFDYEYAAEVTMGPRWQKWSAVTPVGVAEELLAMKRPADTPAESTGVVRFLYIGKLTRFRRLELLLEAIRLAAAETQGFQVDFVGPDAENGFYQRLVVELGLERQVKIHPPVPYDEIPRLLNDKYDVGLAYNPSWKTWDWQPTVKVLEYRAAGLPIISTDVKSHRDFVRPGINGLLLQNTPAEWACAIRRFVEDRPFLREAYRQALAGRQGNTVAQVARLHEQLYLKLRAQEEMKPSSSEAGV
jgi:glycosyltransferase involved in cell wall biosynthesis